MIFNDHSKLEGQHAFLGASTYHWLRWDDQTLEDRYYGQFAQTIGTALHELAKDLIYNRIKLAKSDKKIIDLTLSKLMIPRGSYDSEEILLDLLPFVNDAIGFRLTPEVILYYSMSCFGTSDAIGFDEYNKILRISDYKSGITPAKMDQLMIYAALFCLEYKKNPFDFITELRIYQKGEIFLLIPEPTEIEGIMNLIVTKNKMIIKYLEREYRR